MKDRPRGHPERPAPGLVTIEVRRPRRQERRIVRIDDEADLDIGREADWNAMSAARGQSAICEATVGRKMQMVGNAPIAVIRSMASMVCAMGSMPAIISPDTAPRGSCDAQ